MLRVFDKWAPYTIDALYGSIHRADPIIKDMCAECNNRFSDCDAYMTRFAENHLTGPMLDIPIDIDRTKLLRWVLKTSANHARDVQPASGWWRKFTDFLQNKDEAPDVYLFAAPWYDLRPSLLARMMPVNALDARMVLLHSLFDPMWKKPFSCLNAGWALKVGYAVFAFLDWKEGTPASTRQDVRDIIRDRGWSLLGLDPFPLWIPFNWITCVSYYIIPGPTIHELQAKQKAAYHNEAVATDNLNQL